MRLIMIRNILSIIFILFCFVNPIFAESSDFLVDEFLAGKDFQNPYVAKNYDYTDIKRIAIPLELCETISTNDDTTFENKTVELKVRNDIYDGDNLILKKDDIVKAKVKYIIPNGMNGIPANIYLADFEIDGIDSSKILGTYRKAGLNRMYWVLPLKYALTPLFPLGSLTNFIKGGQSTIKPTDKIIIYYFPNW